jgi:hypothetical protein
MKPLHIFPAILMFVLSGCVIEEEPVLLIRPTVEFSAHVKDEKIVATALISANPDILTPGNIPVIYRYSGEMDIHNTVNGSIIDYNAFSGGGLTQVYTVTADTATHERFIVIAFGTIKAYADIANDGEVSNDPLLASGDFYQEAQYIVSELAGIPNQ